MFEENYSMWCVEFCAEAPGVCFANAGWEGLCEKLVELLGGEIW